MKDFLNEMNKKGHIYSIYTIAFFLLTIAATALRTVACFNDLDEFGYYFESNLMINSSAIIAAASVVFFLSFIWCAREDIDLIPSYTSAANYIPAALVSAALAFLSVALFVFSATSTTQGVFVKRLALVCAILALLAIGYFVVSALYVTRRSIKRSYFGILVLIFICVYAALIYFHTLLPLNAVNKITDLMAYLAIAVFFIYETRLSLGREKWKLYIAFGFSAALLAAYSSIPALILFFAKERIISFTLYENVLTFTFFIFITFKLLLASRLIEDKPSPVVDALRESAARRSKELMPDEPAQIVPDELEEENEYQISFDDVEETEPKEEKDENEPETFFVEENEDDEGDEKSE